MKTDKNIDIELLFFYLGISTISFILYIYRHPIIYIFYKVEYAYGLIKEYLPDLIIFLSVFVPYIIGIFAIIILKLTKNIKISDDHLLFYFFPYYLFYKGMSLFQIMSIIVSGKFLKITSHSLVFGDWTINRAF